MKREKWFHLVIVAAVVMMTLGLGCQPAVIVVTATPPPASPMPSPTPVEVGMVIETPPPPSPPSPASPAPGGCTLGARWVADVTVPDNTVFAPGTPFVKTWRVRNAGTCVWATGTKLVFISGDPMSGPGMVDVPVLAPGAQTDVSVNLVAPAAPGTYRANYQFQSPDGTRFGPVIWVQIIVLPPATSPLPTETPAPTPVSPTNTPSSAPPSTPTPLPQPSPTRIPTPIPRLTSIPHPTFRPTFNPRIPRPTFLPTFLPPWPSPTPIPAPRVIFDFVARANDARWRSGAGDLPWPGSDTDNRGFARWVQPAPLEDGSIRSRALEMHPQWVADGYIEGEFVGALRSSGIRGGDRFVAKVGLLQGANAGNVTFKVIVRWREPVGIVPERHHTVIMQDSYDGSLKDISFYLPLSPLDQLYSFILRVEAGPSPGQDWAVWVEAYIQGMR